MGGPEIHKGAEPFLPQGYSKKQASCAGSNQPALKAITALYNWQRDGRAMVAPSTPAMCLANACS